MSATLSPGVSAPPHDTEAAPGRKAGSLLLMPSVIVLLAWMIVPLVMTLWFSFQYYNLVSPETRGFAGIDNYQYLVTDPDFWVSLENTLILLVSVLVITVGLGTLLAVLFNQPFPGRNIARVLAISPFFVMPTVSALIWKNLLMHPIYGVFGALASVMGFNAVDWFAQFPLSSVIAIVSWEWLPFALLILLTAVQSLDHEQREAARMDGAGVIAQFFFITLPHLSRAIGVVIMIETIFLLTVFAEIFVTTSGGPGNATTNLAFLIYARALLQYRYRRRLGRRRGRHRPRQHRRLLPGAQHRSAVGGLTMRATPLQRFLATLFGWGIALLLFFPIAWMVLTSFKSERDAISPGLAFAPTLDSYREVFARADYLNFALNSVIISLGGTVLALLFAIPGGLCDGVPSDGAHPRHSAVDAVDQDAAAGRRAGADLSAVPHRRAARHPQRPGDHLRADEPADRRLDAVHLLQGSAARDPGGRPHGRRARPPARSGTCCCR